MPTDTWDPQQYHRFQAERRAPFEDLLALVRPITGGPAVDLGCGTGELTRAVLDATGAASVVGIDNSAAMLTEAEAFAGGGVSFREGDIGTFPGSTDGTFDLVIANAALQWVPDHRAVLRRWTRALAPGGQLAVQVPANADHASHRLSAQVAAGEPFLSAFGPAGPPPDPVLDVLVPEAYAELLDELGYVEQHVRLQVYGHRLASTADVVEWVKGTSLTRFKKRLAPDVFASFVDAYRDALLAELGDRAPYFYAFKRVLLWGRRA
ncbi:MAG TPA: methyltransferase domain-containing protein [Acidimicrobiales bacterium]|nr:methyltransferase domain-containing protein [Acidimicrobiales bacterium]